MPTKTASTRSVAKKAPAKKAVGKVPLVYSQNDESFWIADGQILNSLVALKDAFASMDKAVYAHHVTSTKNDFAEWVEQVLGDASCAKSLRASKTPASAKTAVVKHLKNYSI